MSVDGKLSTRRREQVQISGPDDRDRVDQLRADSDAVMVGIETVLADDPSLTVKDSDRRRERKKQGIHANPIRVIADSTARTPLTAQVVDARAPTIVLVSKAAQADRIQALSKTGTDVIEVGSNRVDLLNGLALLEARGIDQLMVEGGGELIYSMFDTDLVDELSLYIAPVIIGGRDAPTLADGDGFGTDIRNLELTHVERIDDGVFLRMETEETR